MERYRKIIPDFEEFKEVIETHQPYDCRVNTNKASFEEVRDELVEAGIGFEQRDWNENFLKLDRRPGKTFLHWLGKIYVQESTSAVPPLAFDLEEDNKVLDMCAAPGSKTTQISSMMNNRGDILANDVKANRTKSLLANVYRLGCVNIKVTERDARQIPEDRKFDRVLVDAPCSAEGNLREKEYLRTGAKMEDIKNVSALQEQLLDKAFRLCREGGEVVYSTCTFAPEENELNVQKFLDRGELVDPGFDFPHSKGVTEWNGEQLDNKLDRCVRVYPHQIDSGGIFVAKFRNV